MTDRAITFCGLKSGVQKTFGRTYRILYYTKVSARLTLAERDAPAMSSWMHDQRALPPACGGKRRKVLLPFLWRVPLVTSLLSSWPIDCTHRRRSGECKPDSRGASCAVR